MTTTDSWIASPEAEAFDTMLAEYDCLASEAHVLMLAQQGIMGEADARAALKALREIEEICTAGRFGYEPGYGAQLTLEKMIVDRVGPEIGYQVHTGRSRNDQVMVAQKLCVRAQVLDVFRLLSGLVSQLIQRAERDRKMVMPGYTHMQPARPTTVGQWSAAYADMFIRDFGRLRDTYRRNDSSPLGAAESHGTTWPLDREYTRDLLGFTGLDEIPLNAISSRGESDADLLASLSFIALHLSKLAQDLLLFNTHEYGYAVLGGDQAVRMSKLTGSSIMPQKRNPDVLELLRGHTSEVYSYLFHALDVLKALPSGYNRDSRDTKAPILRGLRSVAGALDQATRVVRNVVFDERAMRDAVVANYCMATDLAEYLAQQYHVPFREMHGIVGRAVSAAIEDGRPVHALTPQEIAAQGEQAGYELSITAPDIEAGTSPEAALERRANIGGASSGRMEEWTRSRVEESKNIDTWLDREVARIEACHERIRRLADG